MSSVYTSYVIRHTSLCPSFAPYDHESGHDDHLFQQKDGGCSYANSSVQQVIELLLCSLYNDQWMCQVAIFATEGQTLSIHYNSLSSYIGISHQICAIEILACCTMLCSFQHWWRHCVRLQLSFLQDGKEPSLCCHDTRQESAAPR